MVEKKTFPQFAVLHLTCSNLPGKLSDVLTWGGEKGLEPSPMEESLSFVGQSPILLSVLLDFHQCTEVLYRFNFRISCTLTSTRENSVQKMLEFKAYSDPKYFSLPFLQDERLDQELNKHSDDIVRDLEKLDPLRMAFDLAAEADNFATSSRGVVEMKKGCQRIIDTLEKFTHDLLFHCTDEDEAETILEHNPEDNDDDDLDPEEKNWQKALWESRKSFVCHPYYQVLSVTVSRCHRTIRSCHLLSSVLSGTHMEAVSGEW